MAIEGECGVSTAAESKKTNSIDMLHGPLAKKIVLFSIPLAITSILQQLLNSTDAVFAGQWLGGDALAAVGGVAPIISLFVAVFVGLSVGVNVVIADLSRRRSGLFACLGCCRCSFNRFYSCCSEYAC